MSKDYKTPEYALPDYYKRKNKNDDWWDSKSLNYSGNFSRGLSIGNAQSLVLNSNLNLQIQGDLGDGINSQQPYRIIKFLFKQMAIQDN
jgi:hypothetical protein